MEYLYFISDQAATCTAGSTSFTLTGSSSYSVYTIRQGSQTAGTVYTCTQPVTALGDETWSDAGDSEEFQIIAAGAASESSISFVLQAKASTGTSTVAALDTSYTAYDSDGTVNTLLTNGIYDTDSDIGYNRVNKVTGDELTFDLGASASVQSVRIANGNANWGGTESSNQWTIYSGSSLSGSWTSQGTVTFTATSASQEESVTPFASQYIKMTCDTNHGNGNNCVLRQMGFITR